jgi:hypothetical protein
MEKTKNGTKRQIHIKLLYPIRGRFIDMNLIVLDPNAGNIAKIFSPS